MKKIENTNYSVIGVISTILGLFAIIIIVLTYQFLGMLFEGNYNFMGIQVIYILKTLHKLEYITEVIGLLLGIIAVVQTKGKILFGIIGIIINSCLLIWVLYSIITQTFNMGVK